MNGRGVALAVGVGAGRFSGRSASGDQQEEGRSSQNAARQAHLYQPCIELQPSSNCLQHAYATAATFKLSEELHRGAAVGASGNRHSMGHCDHQRASGVAGAAAGFGVLQDHAVSGRHAQGPYTPSRTALGVAFRDVTSSPATETWKVPSGSWLSAASSSTRYDADTRAHGTPDSAKDSSSSIAPGRQTIGWLPDVIDHCREQLVHDPCRAEIHSANGVEDVRA